LVCIGSRVVGRWRASIFFGHVSSMNFSRV
jgi:hypothetical protein